MSTKLEILKRAKKGKELKTSELSKELKISRQVTAFHLKQLVDQGILTKEGSTRNSVYYLSSRPRKNRPSRIRLVKKLFNLAEDKVFQEIDLKLSLKSSLPKNVYRILNYAFSEMLNNAIDHSKSANAEIELLIDNKDIFFEIRDLGIGIFFNIKKAFKLESEFVALEHLLKGKQTTLPERHSGQGIFFTSKISDIFQMRSHKIQATIDNLKDDIRLGNLRDLKGTSVTFRINKNSKKNLARLFKDYANDDFAFDKTNLKISLTSKEDLLSRSQARRILFGLEEYNLITLDFKNVIEVGQAFVDEIFRVFQASNPHVQINYINANDAIHFMIKRGLASTITTTKGVLSDR